MADQHTEDKEIDIEEHLKKWECCDLKTTSMVLELMDLLGHHVTQWKVTVKGVETKRRKNHKR